ncbi:MAG: dipicolinate synthase subunit B [Eubacteriales bacterium]|nr:dipicolinate synthase subunit B [Eubacteriales bacterium]
MLKGKRIGFAMTGSFCTFERVLKVLPEIVRLGAEVWPILSETAYATDTRFMRAEEAIRRLTETCGRPPLHTIVQAEPIGPKKLLDLMIVAPATGNTIGKLAYGITDTCVAMACKAQWRNRRPVLLAISTNDGLSTSAEAISKLKVRADTYFLPYEQDDPEGKPDSLVAKMELLPSFAAEILADLEKNQKEK